MRIPACFAVHLIALHGLITVESILDGTCKNMVNTRMSVSRRRPFKEDKLRFSLSFVNTLVEDVMLLPLLQHVLVCLNKVKSLVFGESLCHIIDVILLIF